MKIILEETYVRVPTRKEEIERELERLEEKLKTPERTLDDLVQHIKLLKEYRQCK